MANPIHAPEPQTERFSLPLFILVVLSTLVALAAVVRFVFPAL